MRAALFLMPFGLILGWVVILVLRFPYAPPSPPIPPLRHHPIMAVPEGPVEAELEIELSQPEEMERLFREAHDELADKHLIRRHLT